MRCGMCEAHINDAVRAAFRVKKVTSSRKAGQTVILSEMPLDPEKLRQTINATVYIMLSAAEEEVKQKAFLPIIRR